MVTFEPAPHLPTWLKREMPFDRRAARVEGKKIHFVDHGHGPAVLLVHGNPTWSYLWRKVIAELAGRVRVIAPDLIGFGLSDKPLHVEDHSLEMNVRTMGKLVDALKLEDVIVCGQDWGGPIAAGVGARSKTHVRGALYSNTAVLRPNRPFRSKLFHKFSHVPVVSDVVFRGLNFPISVLSRVQGDPSSIGTLERRAYRYPLRRLWERAAPLAYARMIPDRETHPSTATLDEIGAWVETFEGNVELVWGVRDPLLGRTLDRHVRAMPHARVTRTDAGHFLQEEVPQALADAIFRLAGKKKD